jgi:hypothetical protein
MNSSFETSGSEDVQLLDILTSYHLLMRDEFLVEPQHGLPIPRCPQLTLLTWARTHNIPMFRRKVRIIPTTFDSILNLIQDHPIFHNNSNNSQTPIDIQLAIVLNRFGHYGNAASPADIGEWAGVSSGTVTNCTKRVAIALLSLHDYAIHLPTPSEKEEAKSYSSKQVCPEWKGGFLTVDGTTVPLFQKPGFHGEAYFDRSSQYSLNLQVSYV